MNQDSRQPSRTRIHRTTGSTAYPRFGFDRAAGYGVTAPFEVPPESWMLYPLTGYSPQAHGTVVYPAAFGRS